MLETSNINYKIIINTRRYMVMAVGIGLVSFFMLILAVMPQVNQARELYADIQKEQPRLEKLETKLQDIKNVVTTPEFSQIEIVNDALPSKKPLLELMQTLYQVADATGVQIVDFEVSPGLVATDSADLAQERGSRNEEGNDLPLEMEVAGTFNQIQDFTILLEKAAPFTTVTQLALGDVGSQDFETNQETVPTEETIQSATLKTSTYFFTQPISVTIEAPLPKLNEEELFVLSELASFRSSDLPEQTEIRGGGLEDLFQVDPLQFGQ